MLLTDFYKQTYPPQAKFAEIDVPDLTGKVVLITGGNSGLGRETARVFLAHNAKVYIGCRSPEKGKLAVYELKKETSKDSIYFIEMDLSKLSSIKKATEEFKTKENTLNILYNNAGVMRTPVDKLTADGYDLQFGTNVLGHYYLTTLLLPLLLSATKQVGEARIITPSSFAHQLGPKESIIYKTLKPDKNDQEVKKMRIDIGSAGLYNQSKCGNIILANELARRYGDQGIVSISLNPGNVITDLGRHMSPLNLFITDLFIKKYPVSLGAITQIYAGAAPEAAKLNGQYLVPWARIGNCRENERNSEVGEKLWSWMEDQVTRLEHEENKPSFNNSTNLEFLI